MTNQDFGRSRGATTQGATTQGATTQGGDAKPQGMKQAAGEAFTKASDAARDAGSKAKDAMSDTAFTVTEQVKELVDRQIGNGASAAGHFASSVKLAADDLERNSPALAGLVRGFATRVEDYADEFQDQTVEQLTRTVSDFTRRQPALVFGLAAVAGFFVFRTLKSASATASPSIQPVQPESDQRYG